MRESSTHKFLSTDQLNSSKSEANSLFRNILDIKSLWLKILPSLRHTPRPQVLRNEYFRENDRKNNVDRYPTTISVAPRLVDVRLEEHEDHHAGDRNVEPDGERPACDSAVHREAARQREEECRQHYRQRDDGKDDVAGQNGKVQRPHRAVTGKYRVPVQRMVHDVADQKNGGEREGQQHARAMCFLVAMLDEIQSDAQRNRTQPVQHRVECR
jgi:hypothetical protein